MTTPAAHRGMAAVLAFAGALAAQEPDAAVTLHEAWLREVVDLDVAAAVEDYRQLAGEPQPRGESWIAVARLLELRRIGVVTEAPPAAADAPPALLAAFAAADEPAIDATQLPQLLGDPARVLAALATEAGRLPPLRTLVPAAHSWWMSQIGPSLRDRWRQRLSTQATRNRAAALRTSQRIYATDVLRAELAGRRGQAGALRALWFTDWRPPEVDGTPADLLARARTNLATLRAAPDTSPALAELLGRLATELDTRAAADPAAALALLRALPWFAERLLQEPSADGASGR